MSSAVTADPVAAARALQPLVRETADEAERLRRLPARVAEAMAGAGLYRIAAPAAYGGTETDPITQIETIEAVAEAGGAAGWNLMIGIETLGLVALTFPAGVDLFADPMTIVCSSTAAIGRAERVDGGYRVNGQWQFVSGCHNARFFGGLVRRTHDGDRVGDGRPVYAFVGPGDFEILDTWHVGGLRGSGSHDVQIDDVVVPDEHMGLASAAWRTELESYPVLRMPLSVRLAYNKVAVALGIARAAVDHFVDLATDKVPRFGSSRLAERPFAQRAVARAEVRLRGARALTMELTEEVWDTVRAGDAISERDRAIYQAASSDAAAACIEVVGTVAEAAGTSANFLSSPLERQLRDVRVVGQHITVAPHLVEDAGRVLLDLEPETFFLGRLK